LWPRTCILTPEQHAQTFEILSCWKAHSSNVYSLLQAGRAVWSCGADSNICLWHSSTYLQQHTRWTSAFSAHHTTSLCAVREKRKVVWALCPTLYSIQIRDFQVGQVMHANHIARAHVCRSLACTHQSLVIDVGGSARKSRTIFKYAITKRNCLSWSVLSSTTIWY
jgi:hypothetical protein